MFPPPEVEDIIPDPVPTCKLQVVGIPRDSPQPVTVPTPFSESRLVS